MPQPPKWNPDESLRLPIISDEEFVARMKRHAEQVAQSYRATYNLAWEDQEDLQQELFLKCLKIPQSMRNFKQYVKTCLNNASRDWWRKRQRREGKLVSLEDICGLNYLANTSDGPEEPVELSESVEKMLAPLTEIQRIVVVSHLGLRGDQPISDLRKLCKPLDMKLSDISAELKTGLAAMRQAITSDAIKKEPAA